MKAAPKNLVLVILVLLLVPVGVLIPKDVGAISNGNDEIYLATPLNKALVEGNEQFSWFMKDPDQTKIPFQVDLFRKNCGANGLFFGVVVTGEKTSVSGGKIYNGTWDTDGPILDKSKINDGNYCMRICAVFKRNPSNFYALCDKHSVKVVNTNRSPEITSNPKGLNLTQGDDFKYDVQAKDPDGDKLTYTFQKKPKFLKINNDSGVITSKGAISNVGSFEVKVKVADGKGGTDFQVFTINVTAQETDFSVSFTSPDSESVFSKDENLVSWNVSGDIDVEEITLFYSTDTEEWAEISSIEGNPEQFSWDVTGMTSGEYYLRLRLKDTSGNLFEVVSDKFTVATDDDDGGGEEVPLITPKDPAEDGVTTETTPKISFSAAPSEGAEIDSQSVTVKLNDTELEDCSLSQGVVECIVETDLELGRHKLFVEVTDSLGQSAVKEWFFEVVTPVTPTPQPGLGENITLFGNRIPIETFGLAIGILCVGLLLLLIPWLLYLFIIRRRQEQSYDYYPDESGTGYEVGDYSPTPDYSTSTGDIEIFTPGSVGAPPADPLSPEPLEPEQPTPPVEPATDIQQPVQEDAAYEPTVGDQTLGEEQFVTPEPYSPRETASGGAKGAEPAHMPSIYSDEEVPDWLKTTDENASAPVSPSGEDFESRPGVVGSDDTSKPYQDYGLASRNEDNPDKQGE
ncbi:MAG: putative Ig domain-containing protein [Candidatus Dojkabacteria bacterium]